MLRYVKFNNTVVPITPNEIMEIQENLPTILNGMPGSSTKGELTKLQIISETQLSIAFLQRKLNREIRITLSRLEEALCGDLSFLPKDGEQFILEIKDKEGKEIRINKSRVVADWMRISSEYFILEGSEQMLKCIYESLRDLSQELKSIKTVVILNKVATFKRDFLNPKIFNSHNSLKINVTALEKRRGEQERKLFFQVVKGSRVLCGFSEDKLSNVIGTLGMVI